MYQVATIYQQDSREFTTKKDVRNYVEELKRKGKKFQVWFFDSIGEPKKINLI